MGFYCRVEAPKSTSSNNLPYPPPLKFRPETVLVFSHPCMWEATCSCYWLILCPQWTKAHTFCACSLWSVLASMPYLPPCRASLVLRLPWHATLGGFHATFALWLLCHTSLILGYPAASMPRLLGAVASMSRLLWLPCHAPMWWLPCHASFGFHATPPCGGFHVTPPLASMPRPHVVASMSRLLWLPCHAPMWWLPCHASFGFHATPPCGGFHVTPPLASMPRPHVVASMSRLLWLPCHAPMWWLPCHASFGFHAMPPCGGFHVTPPLASMPCPHVVASMSRLLWLPCHAPMWWLPCHASFGFHATPPCGGFHASMPHLPVVASVPCLLYSAYATAVYPSPDSACAFFPRTVHSR